MVEPLTTAAIITAATAAAKGGMDAYGNSISRKANKKQRKEDKKKTRADFLLELLKNQLESSQSTRHSQNESAVSRAKSMQDRAAEFRKALTGG